MSNTYPVNFIHVGLGKCASTYLQNVWAADEKYDMLNGSGIVQTVRDAAENAPAKEIALTPPAKSKKKKSILSSEGLTWGWINQPEKQGAVKTLHEVSARILGGAQLSSQVLIVIRNPVDWLRAVHEQSIKEGGSESFSEFLHRQRLLCESVLDLAFVIECFRQYAENVVVLSADELKANPSGFWEKYADCLSVPKPSKDAVSKVEDAGFHANRSLKERTAVLAQLNRHSASVARHYGTLADYHQVLPQEAAKLKPMADQVWIWVNRRLAEFASDEQLAEITASLVPWDQEGFQRVYVDEALKEWIETRFLQPLEAAETVPGDLLTGYRQALSASLCSA